MPTAILKQVKLTMARESRWQPWSDSWLVLSSRVPQSLWEDARAIATLIWREIANINMSLDDHEFSLCYIPSTNYNRPLKGLVLNCLNDRGPKPATFVLDFVRNRVKEPREEGPPRYYSIPPAWTDRIARMMAWVVRTVAWDILDECIARSLWPDNIGNLEEYGCPACGIHFQEGTWVGRIPPALTTCCWWFMQGERRFAEFRHLYSVWKRVRSVLLQSKGSASEQAQQLVCLGVTRQDISRLGAVFVKSESSRAAWLRQDGYRAPF